MEVQERDLAAADLAGGNLTSFIVARRDASPAEPSSWLSSPLA